MVNSLLVHARFPFYHYLYEAWTTSEEILDYCNFSNDSGASIIKRKREKGPKNRMKITSNLKSL